MSQKTTSEIIPSDTPSKSAGVLDASPFKFTLKRKVDLVDNYSTKQRIGRKFKQMDEI